MSEKDEEALCIVSLEEFLLQDDNIAYKATSDASSHTEVKDPIAPAEIRQWTDFNIHAMKTMGHGVFERVLKMPYGCGRVQQTFEAPSDEAGLDMILFTSVRQTVTPGLVQAQQELHSQGILLHMREPGVKMVRGKDAQPVKSRTSQHTYIPDWTACPSKKPTKDYHKFQPADTPVILVGDTKLRCKVDFNILNEAMHAAETGSIDFRFFGIRSDEKVDNAAPLHRADYSTEFHGVRLAIIQIYTYMCNAGCRYGYIITESQLLACRIRPNAGNQVAVGNEIAVYGALCNNGLFEYRVIGYNTKGTKDLSVNLSLWWLHLLAASDHTLGWRYPPLTKMKLEPGPTAAFYSGKSNSQDSGRFSVVSEPQDYDLRKKLKSPPRPIWRITKVVAARAVLDGTAKVTKADRVPRRPLTPRKGGKPAAHCRITRSKRRAAASPINRPVAREQLTATTRSPSNRLLTPPNESPKQRAKRISA